jgi:thiosulfate/3-mercaptopyruvate sulfurtransferase
MRRILITCSLLVALAGPGLAAGSAERLLVTPAWLAEHLNDPSLVVLHVASIRADYAREHIPGARFLWLNWMAESTPERSFELMPVEALDALLERLGVSNSSSVVICHALGDATAAARVYVTLDYLGMGDRAAILDGGLEAWKAEGRPVTKEVPKYRRGRFAPRVRADVVVSLEQVRSRYNDAGVQLVDGRSAQAFNAVEGLGVFRGGHMPGAVNIPFSAVTDSLGRYQRPDTLEARFERAGIKHGSRIITYCNIGRAACPVYVAAKVLGYDVQLYDGSFEEWSRQEDLPLENTGKK